MRLYVRNIPRLASEESLRKWFAEAGLHVKSVQFIRDAQSGDPWGSCFVEINEAGIPKKGLLHLNQRAFWGRALLVQQAGSEIEQAGRNELKAWISPSPA